MIVFDQNADEVYKPISWEIQPPPNLGGGLGVTTAFITYMMTIKVGLDMFPYVKKWFDSYSDDNGMIKSIYKYKRTLYYIGEPLKIEIRFDGCFIKEYRMLNNEIELNLNFDFFSEVVGDVSEIKKKYRDKKIDELLK